MPTASLSATQNIYTKSFSILLPPMLMQCEHFIMKENKLHENPEYSLTMVEIYTVIVVYVRVFAPYKYKSLL